MKQLFFFVLLLQFLPAFCQEKERRPGVLINEYHVSANHGIPLYSDDRTFFGGGLGISHVFRPNRVVGARIGLEADFFHIWKGNTQPPESDKTRQNQHFYLTKVSLPVNLRITLGRKARFLIELGGRFGLIVSAYYTADVLQTGSDYETFFEHQKTAHGPVGLGFFGLNSGIGTLIPLNEKLDLLIRPDVGANLYFRETADLNLYARLCIGIHIK